LQKWGAKDRAQFYPIRGKFVGQNGWDSCLRIDFDGAINAVASCLDDERDLSAG
jgi:hypothetical protein